jgi:cyclic-di-GMP phosphodiesterase TipF (flagellum assembly factor)
MIRASSILIAISMVAIAGALGVCLYYTAGLSAGEAGSIALAALAFLILYNGVVTRMRDTVDVGEQINDLSRGVHDLARQVGEFGRRLVVVETRLGPDDRPTRQSRDALAGEISELGTLVKRLAMSVATHEEALMSQPAPRVAVTAPQPAPKPARAPAPSSAAAPPAAAEAPLADMPMPDIFKATLEQSLKESLTGGLIAQAVAKVMGTSVEPAPSTATATAAKLPSTSPVSAPALNGHASNGHAPANQGLITDAKMVEIIKDAIEANRIDLYLQPLVTLPQRKVRFYEAVSRLRDSDGEVLQAVDFIEPAEINGLMPKIDYMVLFRSVQVLRRLLNRNKDIGLFCNVSSRTLSDPEIFAQCLDFLDANRVLAPSLVLEFKQANMRKLGPAESERLNALMQRGYRLSIDHVSDLRIEAKELADRGVRFIKVPASMLLDQNRAANSNIHPADLSDLLGRYGIDLVAEKIEGESSVVDLLDYDVRYGQGFLFSPPRPLRQNPVADAKPGEAKPAVEAAAEPAA